MAEILVTGGTGTLGRALVARLREQGHVPRVLSRRPGPDRTVGDLETGAGIATAAHGVDAVVHAASRLGGPQVRSMADLARAWAAAGHSTCGSPPRSASASLCRTRYGGRRRVVLPVPLPGRLAAAVRAGGLLAPAHADGRITFEEFLRAR